MPKALSMDNTSTLHMLLSGIGGAFFTMLATLGAALISFRSSEEDRELERERMEADIRNDLRDDLFEQYEIERQKRKEAEERNEQLRRDVDRLEQFAEAAKAKLQEQDKRIDHLCSFIEDHPKIPESEQPDGLDESSQNWPEVPPADDSGAVS